MGKTPPIQRHHINYDQEETVDIYKGEHYLLTKLNRQTKNISKGFIKCLKLWIEENEHKAKDVKKKND